MKRNRILEYLPSLACMFLLSVDFSLGQKELWTWECKNNEKCVKTSKNPDQNAVSLQVCQLTCSDGVLWPYPTGQVTLSKNVEPVNPHSVSLESSSSHKAGADPEVDELLRLNGKILSDGVGDLLLPGGKSNSNSMSLSVQIQLENPSVARFTDGVDESYNLSVKTSPDRRLLANIEANNFFGARHGLETLRQLIVYDPISGGLVMPSEVRVEDKPVFRYRGVLVDTARSFISVPVIKKIIEAMSANKLNTFHWHITDSQSFPFYSKTYPQFTEYGAYSDREIYSEDDIKSIVRHGLIHGVRVLPEFDAPAHVGEGWQWAPEKTTVCFRAEPWQSYCVEPPCGQLNPTSEDVYPILKGIYTDMEQLFQSDIFHMGGDEVNLNCWNSSQVIVENMAKMNMGRRSEDFHDLWSHFQQRALSHLDEVTKEKKNVVLWTSSLTDDKITQRLDKNRYIIQIWTKGDDKLIADLINKGYRVIFSNYDALYFDCGFGSWVGTGNNWCSPYIPWQNVYDNDPKKLLRKLNVDYEKNKELVMGAEAAIWTEQIDDSSINTRLWPRAAAMAERLWSAPEGTWKDGKRRIMLHRTRMVQRGFAPDTLQPEWCNNNEGLCYIN